MRLISLLPVVFALSGCSIFPGCDDIERYAISVVVFDGVTQDTVRGVEVVATAIDGSFRDVRRFTPPLTGNVFSTLLGRERPGSYRVEIAALGYQLWVMHDVRVTEDGCHPLTIHLTPRLRRNGLPSGP